MNILFRNLFALLRNGAFKENVSIEPMSTYKWKTLVILAHRQEIFNYIAQGIEQYRRSKEATLIFNDSSWYENILQWHQNKENINNENEEEDEPQENPCFRMRTKLRQSMSRYAEEGTVDESTKGLLECISENAIKTWNRDISLEGIVELGLYLRIHGHKVDYETVEKVLDEIGLRPMTRLQNQILTELLGFEPEEIPYKEAEKNTIRDVVEKTLQEQCFDVDDENERMTESINDYLKINVFTFKQHFKIMAKYFPLYPMESIFIFLKNMGYSLSQIEE